jgi:hypothetical protein
LFTRGGEFVRTPKSGSTSDSAIASRYKAKRHRSMWFVEMLVGAFCLANWAIYLTVDHVAFSFFLGIYAVGYIVIGWISRPDAGRWRRRLVVEEAAPEMPAGLTPASSTVRAG